VNIDNMDANRKTIDEINKCCSPNNILIIGKDGILRRLYCPFKVRIIIVTQVYQKNQVVFVEAVRISDDLLMLYVIKKFAIPFYYFAILPPRKSG